MRFSIAPAFVLVGLASQSFANVFVTNPVASSVIAAGESFLLQWQINSDAPGDLGNCAVGLYVGTTNVQAQVFQIAASVPTSNVTSLNVTIPPQSGANSDGYFIRFTSDSVQQPGNTQFFAEAFSAKFTMTGMTGTFTPAEISAIQAANATSSTPPGSSGSSSPSSSSPPSFAEATNSASNKGSSSATSSSTGSASTSSTTSKPSQTAASSALSTGINMALFGAFVFGSTGLLL